MPPNTTVMVYVPTRNLADVMEGGRPANSAQGVKFLRQEGDRALFEVNAEQYNFVSH